MNVSKNVGYFKNVNNVDPDQMPHFAASDLGLYCLLRLALGKPAYSNIMKVLPPKNENFQRKMLIFFIFLLKT